MMPKFWVTKTSLICSFRERVKKLPRSDNYYSTQLIRTCKLCYQYAASIQWLKGDWLYLARAITLWLNLSATAFRGSAFRMRLPKSPKLF